VHTQQGRELHNINITHKNTSLCTMNHIMELLKFTYLNVQHMAKQNPGQAACSV